MLAPPDSGGAEAYLPGFDPGALEGANSGRGALRCLRCVSCWQALSGLWSECGQLSRQTRTTGPSILLAALSLQPQSRQLDTAGPEQCLSQMKVNGALPCSPHAGVPSPPPPPFPPLALASGLKAHMLPLRSVALKLTLRTNVCM